MASDDLTNDDRLGPLFDDFVSECDEHLNAARHTVLQLEASITTGIDRATADELFRNVHTIKGLAGMVGLRAVEQLAHQMESYLDSLRQGRAQLTRSAIDALIAGLAALETIIAAQRAGTQSTDIAPLMSLLSALSAPTAAAESASSQPKSPADSPTQISIDADHQSYQQVWRILFTPSQSLAQRGVNVNSVRQRISDAGEVLSAAPNVLPDGQIQFEFLLASQADNSTFEAWLADGITYSLHESPPVAIATAPVEPASTSGTAAPATTSSNAIRVDLAKLDDVMRMVGDLVISRARFDDYLKQLRSLLPAQQWRLLQDSNLAFERQIRDLREGVVRVRLVPVREMFGRMRFVVRDLSRECGKEVTLHLSGQDTEVDKLVVERMMDPLLHLVRNAISHGIEPAADRVKVGKSETASIHLRASASGDTIAIEIEDDGRGIDVQDVTSRARAAGLLGEATQLSEAALLDTICLPHFSTRDQADRTSGRGVGMAIVKSAVEQLGGSLSVETRSGIGTCFRLLLPLTLAIADALIVRVGGQRFAVPQSAVREVIPLEMRDVTFLENNEVISHRGNVVPIVRLTSVFRRTPEANARTCALIVGEGAKAVGLVVDHVIGLHEVVVRPLTDELVRVPGISAATELGDGRVVLILDAQSTIRFAKHTSQRTSPRSQSALCQSAFIEAIAK